MFQRYRKITGSTTQELGLLANYIPLRKETLNTL